MRHTESTPTAQQRASATEALRRFSELVLTELGNRSRDPQTPPPLLSYSDHSENSDRVGRQPFGVVFVEGQTAAFHVPHGRRLVVEYLDINCWGADPHLQVQVTTKAEDMFRNLTLCSAYDELCGTPGCVVAPGAPIQFWEATSNTFLFSQGELRNSATVPAKTCVQLWGYLEPTEDGEDQDAARV